MNKDIEILEKYIPCRPGLKWFNTQPDIKTAWENCNRGDWMLWFDESISMNLRTLTLTKAYCAKTVEHLMKDERSKKAIQVAIDFGNGLATKEELDIAATAAYAAYADVTANASYAAATSATAAYAAATAANTYADAANAAYAAANAAYAAANAANTYADASNAAYAAANAAYAAANANAAALKENRQQTADICRKYLTEEVFKILNIS